MNIKPPKDKNKSERDIYAHYLALGICTTCRKQAADKDSTRCYDCNELRKKKFFPPRTEETKASVSIDKKERNRILLESLKQNKILFKNIGRNIYITPRKNTFTIVTITLFKHSITKGIIYRIRNETKTVSDFYVALFPEDNSVYIMPNPKPSAIYFTLEEIEQYREAYSLL